MLDNIVKIFNSEDEKEVKQGLKDIIIEQFRNDLESYDMYLFNPDKIESMIEDAFQEVIAEAKEVMKKKVFAAFEEKIKGI